jgi:hypothetical protein
MATFTNPARRLALAGGFAFAIAAAPVMVALAAPSAGPVPAVAACPAGEKVNVATGACEPGTSGEISQSTPGDNNSVPEVNGIPCTGADTGKCIGLQEVQQPPVVEPHSTISSSP